MFKIIGKIAALIFFSATILAAVYFTSGNNADKKLIDEVVIEAGSQIKIEDFFNDCPDDAVFVTDVSGIDTDVPGVYGLKVSYDKFFEKDVVLRIEDHTPPQGVAVPQFLYTTWKKPDAVSCVDELYDLSGIAEIKYKNGIPEFKRTGDYEVPVSVTDVYGNSTDIMVPFNVINDRSAPVIKGAHDFEVGDGDDPHELDLLNGVTVFDDHDDKPVLKVDDSRVDYSRSGEYVIIYSAIDKAGNIGTARVKVKVTIPGDDGENTVEEEDLDALYYYYTNNGGASYGMAEKILEDLWGDNDVDTAFAIFNWVHTNISYMNINYYQSYEAAAFRGFAARNGDCYVYYSCCKMLLDLAGIPNMMVTRYPSGGNGHFWNLVKLQGEWYHCDATRFMYHPGFFFMCTDDEIEDSHHQFDGYLYPKRAGGSREYSSNADPDTQDESVEDTSVNVTPDNPYFYDTDEHADPDENAVVHPDDPVLIKPDDPEPVRSEEPDPAMTDDRPASDQDLVKPVSEHNDKHDTAAAI